MTVADFMAEALWHPTHGYYAVRDPLGAAGDFVTAPEISQMFGELIGAWCAVQWQAMGRPDPVRLVELGPGRGTLMADALRADGARCGVSRCPVDPSGRGRRGAARTPARRAAAHGHVA